MQVYQLNNKLLHGDLRLPQSRFISILLINLVCCSLPFLRGRHNLAVMVRNVTSLLIMAPYNFEDIDVRKRHKGK